MEQRDQQQDISKVLTEVIALPRTVIPNDGSQSAASQTNEVIKLKRELEKVTLERDGAIKRASDRYREMILANRAAERAAKALDRETMERRGQKIRTTALISSYKIRLQTLQRTTSQVEDGKEKVQALETANAALGAALAQQKEATVKAQLSAQATIQEGIGACRTQVVKEAEQLYNQRLDAAEKRINNHAAHEAQMQSARFKEKFKSLNDENRKLREQLKTLQATHKARTMQRTTQLQNSQMAAGIRAGFRLPNQQSPAQVKVTPGKRRRGEPYEYATLSTDTNGHSDKYSKIIDSTLKQQRGHRNSESSDPPATPSRAVSGSTKRQRHSQQTMTPARLNSNEHHRHPSMKTNAIQPLHDARVQAQPSRTHVQSAQHQRLFLQFLQQENAARVNAGVVQIGASEAMQLFNAHMAGIQNLGTFVQLPNPGGLYPMPQQQAVGHQTTNQAGPQRTSSESTPMEQEVFASLGSSVPLSGKDNEVQKIHPCFDEQQQFGWGDPQTGNAHGRRDLMPFLTSSHDADLPNILAQSPSQIQATPSQASGFDGDPFLAHHTPSQSEDLQLYPDFFKNALHANKSSGQANTKDWDSLAPNFEGDFPVTRNGASLLDDLDLSNILNGPSLDAFAESVNDAGMPTSLVPSTQADSHTCGHEEMHGNASQQGLQQCSIDQLQIDSGQSHLQIPLDGIPGANWSEHSLVANGLTFDQAPRPHPTTARKYLAPPPPARSVSVVSGRSTPSQATAAFPVCLHCHESWWNETCDIGEPCRNCIGSHTACERPKCLNFARETCTNARCARVHEGDVGFDFVVEKPKTLKRVGKKDERRRSPVEMALEQV